MNVKIKFYYQIKMHSIVLGHIIPTQIREDEWIPTLPAAKTISPTVVLPPATSVSALLDEGSRSWNVDLIRQEFLSHEANLILGIPLSDRIIPDKFVWLPSPNGNYTTRSAYRLLYQG